MASFQQAKGWGKLGKSLLYPEATLMPNITIVQIHITSVITFTPLSLTTKLRLEPLAFWHVVSGYNQNLMSPEANSRRTNGTT